MSTTNVETKRELIVSQIAETLIGSEIIRLAWEVNEKIRNGEKIHNLTIGDFNPKIFPIPAELKKEIIEAYLNDETNYPPAEGIADLRSAVSEFLRHKAGLHYKPDEVIIAGGARPIIYSTFRTLVNAGDTVVFPVPSWNNNHYTHLNNCRAVMVETTPENNFMPAAAELEPHLGKADLVALCSPLNPSGTVFTKDGLHEICDLIIAENKRRSAGRKPLYLMYDQIYWTLTFGKTKHYDPVTLHPAMRDYTVFVDGISKSFASTGVRVGWAFGPKKIMDKMKSILGHIGAWAPKAEQVALAKYLRKTDSVNVYLSDICKKVNDRLTAFHKGFQELKEEGLRVDSIAPQAAIYLTVQFKLHGQKTPEGKILQTTKEVTKYILDEGKIAIVPFYAFGSPENSSWYRLSVGTCKLEEVSVIIQNLGKALRKLS